MIVIKLELWPHGDESRSREIGRAYIANDGKGEENSGNYDVAICRRGTTAVPFYGKNKPTRRGRVENYPRLSYSVWRLILRSLKSAFPEEK